MENILLMTDSYKVTHWNQYPPNTSNVYSYFESRGGMFKEVTFFGLQYLIKNYLSKPIEWYEVNEAESYFKHHFGNPALFNKEGWRRIIEQHAGYLPVRIKAVPEGTTVPVRNVLMTIENTDPKLPWLTNYLETLLSQIWYPTTVATLSREVKKIILDYLYLTGDPNGIDFKLHDFGFRGATSVESAALGGTAHLVNFKGTDTVAALWLAKKFYGEDMAGFSIPASEHSTITAWGKENELSAYRNMINQYGDNALYACVSDSYDVYEATNILWGTALKNEVMNANGTLVIRPDSGDPPEVIINLLEILDKKFGSSLNEKRYKVLNPKVRLIWGDGLDYNKIQSILFRMKLFNWSADNIAFGMGGGLLQKMDRDTQRFAFKTSSVVVDGTQRDVFKLPKTDLGKRSKKGRMSLIEDKGNLITVEGSDHPNDILEVVYDSGQIEKTYTLAEIRERASLTSLTKV